MAEYAAADILNSFGSWCCALFRIEHAFVIFVYLLPIL